MSEPAAVGTFYLTPLLLFLEPFGVHMRRHVFSSFRKYGLERDPSGFIVSAKVLWPVGLLRCRSYAVGYALVTPVALFAVPGQYGVSGQARETYVAVFRLLGVHGKQ